MVIAMSEIKIGNGILLAVYDLSIANAPISPQDARLIADDVACAVGRVNDEVAVLAAENERLKTLIKELKEGDQWKN